MTDPRPDSGPDDGGVYDPESEDSEPDLADDFDAGDPDSAGHTDDYDPADADSADFADDNEPGDADCADYAEPARDDDRADDGPPDDRGAMAWPLIPAQAGAAAPGCRGLPAWLRPKVPGRIRLTVPWRTLAGIAAEPGDLSWIGPITPAQARDLAAAAAAGPGCTWRLIITDDHGRAAALTTLGARRTTGAGPPGLVSEVTLTITRSLAAALAGDRPPADRAGPALAWLTTDSSRTQANFENLAKMLAAAIPAANLAANEAAVRAAADQAAGGCAHTMQAPGYRVPATLRRWLNTRDRTCRNPICRQPAARCDQDHTIAYHRGGRTCSCNLGGLCRLHHGLKQLPGWQLTQDAQGHFTWRTPAGLTYREKPHQYAI